MAEESALRETFRAEAERMRSEERAAERTRALAGMGFWRLVFVVTFGILIAKAASWAATWIFLKMTTAQ